MEVREINRAKYNPATAEQREDAKRRIKQMQKEGEKLVKGIFEFVDAQGGWLDFNYRFFPGEPTRCVRINHGEIVDLPMILVKHLNNVYKKVRVANNQMTEDGRFIGAPSVTKISRTRFTPMDVL